MNGEPGTVAGELAGAVTPGQVAFEAYAAATGGRSAVTGAPLPAWPEMPEPVRVAWEAAGAAVRVYQVPGELDALDREAARLFASEVCPMLLAALQPGLGPMLIPADIARVIAAAHGWRQEWQLLPGADGLTLSVYAQPDGTLALSLRWQGGVTVWSGVLRPAAPVTPQ